MRSSTLTQDARWTKRSSVRAVLILMGLGISVPAVGYVLPSYSIVRHLANTRDDLSQHTLKVDGALVFYGEAATSASSALGTEPTGLELPLQGQLSLKSPGRCRLEARAVGNSKSVSSISAQGRHRSEGTELPAVTTVLAELCPLFARGDSEGRGGIDRLLASLKVDVHQTALARFGGLVTYVIGDLADNHPQLWVYKDSFQPARLRFTEGSGAYDIRLLDYASTATGDAFPRIVEVVRDGQEVFRFSALKSDPHARLDDALF